ncbi:hypothetical protein DPMN_031820 [Dreissena polymorpha]|uniref:Uncharacterized protein n=1 Tax=Dreissena polymorpha TaxID=45954 RepID=A0A9D4M2U3_DREPO|nr:hypothetical protein DPMN_031820 [Dreissena polymorpha]
MCLHNQYNETRTTNSAMYTPAHSSTSSCLLHTFRSSLVNGIKRLIVGLQSNETITTAKGDDRIIGKLKEKFCIFNFQVADTI